MGEREIDFAEMRTRIEAAGQGHVFRWWDELNPGSRRRLARQLASVDFDLMDRLSTRLGSDTEHTPLRLEPPEIIALPRTDEEKRNAREAGAVGESLIRSGKVAAFLVAGGQGTRLGFDGPKGMFPVGPVTGKSLFQMHAEKILAAGRAYGTAIPWYIMTSQTNDDPTRAYFQEHDHFGLPRENVMFFTQEMIPALDGAGKLILDARDHVFMNPDGHGGSLLALVRSGAVEDMKSRGVEVLSYFQVDNVLLRIIDPVFLGHHRMARSEMSSKMVRKRHSRERVGVFGRVDGRLRVIEYSDMSEEDMEARGGAGGLKYDAGSIAIHALDVPFVEEEARDGFRLPYHVAHKRIPFLSDSGELVRPEAPNAYKFETFVFDALRDARNAIVMEVSREEEFSPVKNRTGEDSPRTAKRDLSNFFGRWLEAAGLSVPRDADGNVREAIEISPLLAMDVDAFVPKVPEGIDVRKGLYLGPE